MRRWVTCSSLLLLIASPGWAQAGLTQDEALRVAFPAPAAIERRTAYLGERELAAAQSLAGPDGEITQSVITYYVGLDHGVPLGAAYFDGHVVRTPAKAPDGAELVVTLAEGVLAAVSRGEVERRHPAGSEAAGPVSAAE